LSSSSELQVSPRSNGRAQAPYSQQTVEVSTPQPWSPPRSAPTPIVNNTQPAPSPVYNSSPSQFAVPPPPPPVEKEKKKMTLKDKLKAKLVGGGWLIDKNAPPKQSSPTESPKSPPSSSPSSGGKEVTTNKIVDHIQKNYNDPAPSTSPQLSTSPRNASPLSSTPPPRPTTPTNNPPPRPATPANTAPPLPVRPAVTPAVNPAPPLPAKSTLASSTTPAQPSKSKEDLVPKKDGDVLLVNSSFGKQPAGKPIQKVNVPAPPPSIKNKDVSLTKCNIISANLLRN